MVDIIFEHQANEIREQRAALGRMRSVTECESRFRSLTALLSDWYWEQDKEFRFTLVEGAGANVVGYDTTLALGKKRWELPYEGMTDELWRPHQADLRAHRTFHDLKLKTLDENGRAVWISISGEPILNCDGRFIGYRGIGRDITRRKPASKRIARPSSF